MVIAVGARFPNEGEGVAIEMCIRDRFWGMAPASTLHSPFIKQGKVIEIGQYVDKFAPNVKKMFEDCLLYTSRCV